MIKCYVSNYTNTMIAETQSPTGLLDVDRTRGTTAIAALKVLVHM